MADYERKVLEFYQLPTPYPEKWPAEKDAEEESAEDDHGAKKDRRKSRYEALESAFGARRSFVGENGQGGIGNLVQKDEPDPLGTSDSVVRSLQQLGLPVQDDARLSACS
ncbi:Exocyst complex component S5 [Metarhizium acridum]|nr:Exocyst complex component S5 [Metarhizium acridum]